MVRHLFILIALLLSGFAPATFAAARLALVIGNGSYADKPLKNPTNDATDLARSLKESGFEVMLKLNLSADQMKEALADFGEKLAQDKGVGLFYFSGHGVQNKRGQNYLLPVNRSFKTERDVELFAVEARQVLAEMSNAGNPLNIVILDACRDSPLPADSRSAGSRGLGRMEAPSGSLIAFAAAPGQTASDNQSERNGLYTKHLLQAINTPGLRLEDVFKQVGRNVEKASSNAQSPEEMTKLRDDAPFYFRAPSGERKPTTLANLDLRPAPKPPTGGDLNLDDLERQASSRREQEAKQKAEWAAWQQKMQTGFDRASRLSGGADLQIKAWEQFLTSFAADNPYSNQDDSLRQQAQQKLASAQAELARQRQATTQTNSISSGSTGQAFRDCNDAGCPEMVWIPKGSFMMGSNESDREKPIHQVSINYDLAVGKYPVTFAQWDACVAAGGCSHQPKDYDWGRGNRPVINVNWHDAQQYARWLSQKTARPYRLLSEAEWEYSARAGTTTRYYWGDEVGNNHANCKGCNSQWIDRQTSPVGSFAPNAWGIYDMVGNVQNWVEDCWTQNYSGGIFSRSAPVDGRAWKSGNCDRRVMRGGSWFDLAQDARVAFRDWQDPLNRDSSYGFRVARTKD